ncbi:MAG: DUF975 family protein [Oscillospiraceae bacterium]
MWTNELLKNNAKECLKRYYWYAVLFTVLVGLVTGAVTGSISGIASFISQIIVAPFSAAMTVGGAAISESGEESVGAAIGMIGMGLGMIVIFTITYVLCLSIGIACSAFVQMPFQIVGLNRYFMSGRYRQPLFDDILYAIKSKKYMKIVKVSFFYQLYIILWSMLFIIPGIIKSFEYFLVPYIIAENPDIPKERVFEISRNTMEGEKMNCFILGLSFIGWYLLAMLATMMTFGLGSISIYFLTPYVSATFAEFYACMREKALTNGFATKEELIGFEN